VTYVDETRAPLTRNAIMERLQERGIATRPGTHAVHTLGYYRQTFGTRPEDCPRARGTATGSPCRSRCTTA
jgi:dTDP-4-amino-4,6-dideoxygalactose transaminase